MGRHPKKKPQVATKDQLKLRRKERKLKLKQKRARLVVRNLPFETTEENLRKHFETFGDLEEVKVLKTEEGKNVGCGFVQYKLVQNAAKARHHLNATTFLNRDIQVDFALAKDKYLDKPKVKQEEEVTVKEEPVEIGDEPVPDETKIEIDSDSDKSDDESKGDSDESEVKSEQSEKPKFQSNDVVEGRTVFIKNVPFSATNEDLKECMKKFGPVYYALICVDKLTEHSKGTAFVKFVNPEDAEKALAAGTELTLLGNVLDCHKALGRNEVQQKNQKSKEVKKDNRNLYLVKEGVILAGSKAAEGVSATDMAKRLQLEQYKTQMLRNLNMFVSKDRLAVHNLPPSWDDKKFRALVENNCPKNAVIKEARIMRDLKNVDASGLGKSKEFGFVAFTSHEAALATLRALNNNPNIFSANRRPIVSFSIENKAMLRAKQKRLEKSRITNPKSKSFDPEAAKEAQKKRVNYEEIGEGNKFSGVAAKPGVVMKMRSRHNLRTQAQLHHENLKKEKKKQKLFKSLKEKKQEFTKQPKQKIHKKKENDHFSKLVSKYKQNLLPQIEAKKKWYDA